MIERRHAMALDCFLNADRSDTQKMFALPDLVELRCRDFRLAHRGRGIVDVVYAVEYRVSMGDSLNRFDTGDRLHLTHRGWKIATPLVVANRR